MESNEKEQKGIWSRVKTLFDFSISKIDEWFQGERPAPDIAGALQASPDGQRDDQRSAEDNIGTGTTGQEMEKIRESRAAELCPYCLSKNFVKRGTRKNVNQVVQLYLCRNFGCGRTFTAQDIKGKHFPLHIIIESMSYYNLGLTLEDTCRIIKGKFGVAPEPATLSDWINEYKSLCRYERLRPYAIKMFSPKDVVEVTTMAHRQLYRFRYHRAKTILMLEEFRNRTLVPLKTYLDNVTSETPHQFFQDGERMSEIRSKFDKADMIVRSKFNYANRLTAFVLQSIPDNKQRHEELQRFMIANDSCTVATEVPVYIRREDVEHMENELNFKISDEGMIEMKGDTQPRQMPRLLTGHIDIVQVRNGQVHLLDYKPNASKEKPIEQLTWYALAMSRLTGLRIYNFVCGWFDEKDYYQFYPLHVVKKLSGKKKRRVYYRSGEVAIVPKENELTIVPRRPSPDVELPSGSGLRDPVSSDRHISEVTKSQNGNVSTKDNLGTGTPSAEVEVTPVARSSERGQEDGSQSEGNIGSGTASPEGPSGTPDYAKIKQ